METKNIILTNYVNALVNMIANVSTSVSALNDNRDENAAIIATLNVQLESMRSELILIQNALDTYFE